MEMLGPNLLYFGFIHFIFARVKRYCTKLTNFFKSKPLLPLKIAAIMIMRVQRVVNQDHIHLRLVLEVKSCKNSFQFNLSTAIQRTVSKSIQKAIFLCIAKYSLYSGAFGLLV